MPCLSVLGQLISVQIGWKESLPRQTWTSPCEQSSTCLMLAMCQRRCNLLLVFAGASAPPQLSTDTIVVSTEAETCSGEIQSQFPVSQCSLSKSHHCKLLYAACQEGEGPILDFAGRWNSAFELPVLPPAHDRRLIFSQS